MSCGEALASSPTKAFPKLLFFPLLQLLISRWRQGLWGNFLGKAGWLAAGRPDWWWWASQLSQLGLLTHSLTQASLPADSRIKAPVNFKESLECYPHTLSWMFSHGEPPGHLTGKTCLSDESQITWNWQVNNNHVWSTLNVNESEDLSKKKDVQVHLIKLIYSCNIGSDKCLTMTVPQLNLQEELAYLKNPEEGML